MRNTSVTTDNLLYLDFAKIVRLNSLLLHTSCLYRHLPSTVRPWKLPWLQSLLRGLSRNNLLDSFSLRVEQVKNFLELLKLEVWLATWHLPFTKVAKRKAAHDLASIMIGHYRRDLGLNFTDIKMAGSLVEWRLLAFDYHRMAYCEVWCMAWLREVGLGERIVVLCLRVRVGWCFHRLFWLRSHLWTISAALELLDAVNLARDWLLIKIIII